MEPITLLVAFVCGFAVSLVRLPPLIGFLVAGFILHGIGFNGGEDLQELADLGVTLLLFSIGLKLNPRSLLRREIWAGASLHMAIAVPLLAAILGLIRLTGLGLLNDLSAPIFFLIAFALSFSSTVFAIKVFEESGQMGSLYARAAVGILIMQDLFAVAFLTIASGKVPSAWALAVPLVLYLLRPLLYQLLDRCGHGELLILLGFILPLVVGAAGFELVGLKADLGALVLGVVLSAHPKASELSKTLLNFKDLFLIGFFLTIGLNGFPSLAAIGLSALLLLAIPLKTTLFYLLLTRFHLRARPSLLASLGLGNYSEFGLIVASLAVARGWLTPDWLVTIAVTLAGSFVIGAPLNSQANRLYLKFSEFLQRFETSGYHPEEQPISIGGIKIGIVGMGRIGTAAYDLLVERYGPVVMGIDFDPKIVKDHQAADRWVVLGDPTDPDFWSRLKVDPDNREGKLILLTMSNHKANLSVAHQLREYGYRGTLAANAHFEDERDELLEAGVEVTRNIMAEAGLGLARDLSDNLDLPRIDLPDSAAPETQTA